MKVVYGEQARTDISLIYDYMAEHNPAAAQRMEDAIRAACDGLEDFPYSASATDEPNVRRLPLVRYLYTIFYRAHPGRE
jgi:plasmid stabilization system protein ParE